MSRAGKSSKRTAKKKTAPKPLLLPEVLDLTAAAPLAQSFLSRRGTELSVDASSVRRVGAQCLQVILAAAMTWKADGLRLSLDKPTEEFLEGTRLLGIRFDQEISVSELA
jgi:chemotaxis protein CheX